MEKKVRFQIGLLLEIFIWALIVFSLLRLASAFDNPVTRQILYNADALYPAMLFRDLVELGGKANGWITPPSLQLFPDLLLYFVQAAVVRDVGARQFVFAALQYLLLIVACVSFMSAVFADDPARRRLARRLVLAAAVPPVLLAGWVEVDQGYLIAFLGTHHLGPWINMLLCSTLLVHPRLRLRIGGNILLFVLTIAGTISDPLFIVLFLPGAVIAPAFMSELGRGRRLALILMSMTAFAVGLRLLGVLRNELPVLILDYEIASRLRQAVLNLNSEGLWTALLRAGKYFMNSIPWITWGTPVLAAIGAFLFRKPDVGTWSLPRTGFYCLSAACLSNMGVLFVTGGLLDFFATRYLPALFFGYMPLLGLAAILLPSRNSEAPALMHKLTSLVAPALMFSALFLFVAGRGFPRPPLVRCLDEHAPSENLKVGYGDYWRASPINLYSRAGVRLIQVNETLRPNFRANSFLWYLNWPAADFIIPNRLDETFIRKFAGPPTRILTCGDERIFLLDEQQKARLRAHRAQIITDIGTWRIMTGR